MAIQNKQGEAITGINVTPLVDITLVLLIIFMATCHLIAHRAMNLNLPKAANTESTPTPSVQVMMSADRSLTLNVQNVTRQELALNRRHAMSAIWSLSKAKRKCRRHCGLSDL